MAILDNMQEFKLETSPKLIYENESFILMQKPHGLATVPLKKQADVNSPNETLLWHAAGIAPQILDVLARTHGRAEPYTGWIPQQAES